MAHAIDKVLVGTNWQGNDVTSNVAAFTGAGGTIVTPPAPAVAVDILPGGITAYYQHALTVVNTGAPPFTPPTAPTGVGYFMINFAMYDPIQGKLTGDPIRYDQILRVPGVGAAPGTPHEIETPQITLFHLPYTLNNSILQGEEVTITVNFTPDHREFDKQPIVTSYRFPGNIAAVAALLVSDVQQAHWVIMEALLAADPGQRLFNHGVTRQMSTNFGFMGVFLVGNTRQVYQADNFQQDAPYKFTVAIRTERNAAGYPNVQEDPQLVGPNQVLASFATGRAGIFEYLRPRQGNGTYSQVNWHWTNNLGYRGHYQSTTFPFNRKALPINDVFAQFDRFEIEHWNRASSPSPMNNDLTEQRLTIYLQRFDGGGPVYEPAWDGLGANSYLYGTVGAPFPSSVIAQNPFQAGLVFLDPAAGFPGVLTPDSDPATAAGNINTQLPYNNLANAATPIGGAPNAAVFTANSQDFSDFLQAVANYMFT